MISLEKVRRTDLAVRKADKRVLEATTQQEREERIKQVWSAVECYQDTL